MQTDDQRRSVNPSIVASRPVRFAAKTVGWLGLHRRKIGTRLTWSFLTIVSLMMATDLATLWQFVRLRSQAELVRQVDEESHAVLRVHADVLMLRDKLEDLAAAQDSRRFVNEARVLRSTFLEEVEHANGALRIPHSNLNRDPTMLSTLETIQSALPAQIDALSDLASIGDWPAVRLRLENHVAQLSSLTSSLYRPSNGRTSEERLYGRQAADRRITLDLGQRATAIS